jgi:nitroreductase
MGDIRSVIRSRRSCRDFSNEPLSKERITELINESVWVPTGSNNQPWRFVVIADKNKMKKYSDAAKAGWLRNLDKSPHMLQYEEYLRNPDYNVFYNAPAIVVVYGNSQSYWHVYDCTMVAYNIHLLAEDSGLGCCWIGFAHNVFSDPQTKKELGVPDQYELVAPLILGNPAKKTHDLLNPNARKPFEISYF